MVTGADSHVTKLSACAGAVLLLACLPLGLARAEPKARSALEVRGTASFATPGPLGQQGVQLRIEVANPGKAAVELRAADLLLCHPGGWLVPLATKEPLLAAAATLAPGAARTIMADKATTLTPATHVLVTVRASDGVARHALPILRTDGAFEAPAACRPTRPFGVGVVGPLEAVPFSDGRTAVLLIGQHQVLDGPKPSAVETTVTVSSDKGSVDPLTWAGLDGQGDRRALWPFARHVQVFDSFATGRIQLSARAVVDGRAVAFTDSWPVVRVEPARLDAPVLGRWQLSNGPGQIDMTDHYADPQFRYAYDMVVLKQGRTHAGDPHSNDSYFAWNRSVRAAADGKIVASCDLERDNPGHRGSLGTCHDNHVVIEHADGLYTAYLHLRQGSVAQAFKKPGVEVEAGQVIARVGNSGDSSEPHLHFMAFRIDATGRRRSVPVTFANASHDAKGEQPVRGVPLGGHVYHFRGR